VTLKEAMELVQGWPKDRSVPRKLKAGIDSAKVADKVFMEQLVEALMAASETKADFEMIGTYFN
jgi:hypothetical protein